MPLILPGNVASAVPTAFSIDNSCRFDDGDTAWVEKDSSSVAEKKIGTISFWMKRGNITAAQTNIVNHNDTGYCVVALLAGSQIRFYSGEHDLSSTAVLRDPAAWYHIFANWDTTQGVAANRAKLYVNGVQVTLFATETYPDANDELPFFVDSEAVVVGRNPSPGNYFDGYLAEVVALEGTAAAVTDFGEFDSDSPTIWKPIEHDQSSNKGANGFYLDFKDSANLGNDAYGGTDLAETDLAATDQATDTPTNNFCTLNPLDSYWESSTFSEGNCKIVTESTDYSYNTSTIGLTAGKWYFEIYIEATPHATTKDSMLGIAGRMSEASQGYLGLYDDTYGMYGGTGKVFNNGSQSDYGLTTHTTDDVIGVYIDLDNNKLYFAKNGVIMNSGTGISITAVANTKAGAYFPVAADYYNGLSGTYRLNFGNPIYSLSSAVADANGYGAFEYDPSDGGGSSFDSAAKDFLAICTKNLGSDGG